MVLKLSGKIKKLSQEFFCYQLCNCCTNYKNVATTDIIKRAKQVNRVVLDHQQPRTKAFGSN